MMDTENGGRPRKREGRSTPEDASKGCRTEVGGGVDRRRLRHILHIDADAFFASVEQALNPKLKGLPVIVGGTDRGVVSAASYEARRYGIHSAMPISQARRLCPHGIFLSPHFDAYRNFSTRMFAIAERYSPVIEKTSVDEGYVDLTGVLRLHGAPPWEIAHRMLHEIRSELQINASGGLAGDRVSAKMATGLAKPNGLLYLEPDLARKVLGFLPVGETPGVGRKARGILEAHGIRTVADLAATPPDHARRLLGKFGEQMVYAASGKYVRPLSTGPRETRKSYSKDMTLARDTTDRAFLLFVTRELAERLATRLRQDRLAAGIVTFKVRYSDFTEKSRSRSLREPTDTTSEILRCVNDLFQSTVTRRVAVRQVGVKLSGIAQPSRQRDLFGPDGRVDRLRDRAVDRIRARFGFQAIGHPCC